MIIMRIRYIQSIIKCISIFQQQQQQQQQQKVYIKLIMVV